MEPENPPYVLPEKEEILSVYQMVLSSDFGIWLWEPETDKLFFNKTYMDMLGFEHNAFPFHISTWENLIHPDDRAKIVSAQRRALFNPELGDAFEHRFRFRNVSGEYIWILGRGFVICRDQNGQAIRVSGMHIDLNSMDTMLKEVATQHDRMWFALETGNDGLWDWNPQDENVYFSPRYISMLGYTPEQFPPHVSSWSSRVHPDDLDATVKRQYEHVSNPGMGDRFECVYRFLAADERWRWILGRGKIISRNATGKATRVVGLHTDITDLRTVQDDLAQMLNTDALTKLHSRFFFDRTLNMLKSCDYPVSIIYADIDGLKLINDNLGHAVGDRLLISAADILRDCVDSNTIAARIGGDEFAILLLGCSKKKADIVLHRIQNHFAARNANANPNAFPVFMAFGVVSADADTPQHKLMAQADRAMLQNKAAQRSERHQTIKAWIEGQTGAPIICTDSRL